MPPNPCMCQKKAAVTRWLIIELPLTKDRRPSSYNVYMGLRHPVPHLSLAFLFCKPSGLGAGDRERRPSRFFLGGGGVLQGSKSRCREEGEMSPPSPATLACPRGTDCDLSSIKEHQTAPGSKPAPTQTKGSASPPPPHSGSEADARELGSMENAVEKAHCPPPPHPSLGSWASWVTCPHILRKQDFPTSRTTSEVWGPTRGESY